MREALIQWGCARKLYVDAKVSMQCKCVRTNMVRVDIMHNTDTRMANACNGR